MRAHLLTIGDELLIGQTTNTNAAWLGEQLTTRGIRVARSVTVGDDASTIRRELERAYADATLVVTTGGLGPTHDDLTKEVVADYFDRPLATDDALLAQIRSAYDRRERDMAEKVKDLAEVPDGFDLLDNPVGTAPGLWYQEETGGRERLLAVLPGVPTEMKRIAEASLFPRLEQRSDRRTVTHRTLQTTGIGESDLQAEIGDVSDLLDDEVHLAYLPSTSGVRLRLTSYSDRSDRAAEQLDRLEEVLRERAGQYIFGTGTDTLEAVLGDMLRSRGLTVATAESATGGYIGHRLTNVPGSSDYYLGGVVAYANSVKVGRLGVSEATLEADGAVSEAVARQMARGVREATGASIGISTTGIAGPGGGTDEKPVGTVWIGYADDETEHAVRQKFLQDRMMNKDLFSTAALDVIRRQLERKEASAPAP
jgi:nicotinamide-nucleotide amidase